MSCDCGRLTTDRVIEESMTAAHDPDVAGVGASYRKGDTGGFLFVPQTGDPRATAGRLNFRLTDPVQVQAGECVWILNVRLFAQIAEAIANGGEAPDGGSFLATCEVTSPDFRFDDGNISWHLRTLPGSPMPLSVPASTAMPAPSVSSDIYDGPAAQLLNPTMTATAFGGQIPGDNVGPLGTMRNKPFLWQVEGPHCLRYRVEGPCSIVLYASVLQTDPDTRNNPPTDASVAGASEEFVFWRNHLLCQYRHIGGSIIYEREVRSSCIHCRKCKSCCGANDACGEARGKAAAARRKAMRRVK